MTLVTLKYSFPPSVVKKVLLLQKKNPIYEPNCHILCEIAVGLKYPER